MKTDCIIVGQGIAGTLTAMSLIKHGKRVIVIDNGNKRAASKVSSGIINPITGRRFVKSWRFDALIADALATYQELEQRLSINIIKPIEIVRSLHSIMDENIWAARSLSDPEYCQTAVSDQSWNDHIKDVTALASVKGWKVDIKKLLSVSRDFMSDRNSILDREFSFEQMRIIDNKIQYRDIESKYIIFCEGWRAIYNPYFQNIELDPAKGEVLIVKIKGLHAPTILKHKLFIVPTNVAETYWVGSTYDWNTDDEKPTDAKRTYLKNTLKAVLKLPYEIIDQEAGIRPTTKQRRPVLLRHDTHLGLILLNGLGTKGVSLAPHYVKQLIPMVSC